MSKYSLPEDRLQTTDEKGNRVYIHPHDVKGPWKNLRTKVYWFLILLYLVLPWIYIGGKQVILLDLPAREFYIFGKTFYGHDGPFLIFLLLGFLFFFAFVTSVWGRVWCGFACPQTVFIDTIYRFIERKIEGVGPKRDKLERAPWNLEKIVKRFSKWLLYTIVSMHIVHSGIGYFVGTHKLLYITMQSPTTNLYLFVLMLTITAIILFDFGWFREQFCIIACPYGRFQSLVMDENSLIISYDKKRGEPRKRTKGIDPNDLGDCVNCNRCVNVCPTGIDIREGLQMECIACTMCIDACDDIMKKVKKPTGLIRYTTETQIDGKKKKYSPRVYLYGALFIATIFTLMFSLSKRQELKVQVIREGKSPYQYLVTEKKVINRFSLRMRYMNPKKETLSLHLLADNVELIAPEFPLEIENENINSNIFLKFPKSILKNGKKVIQMVIKEDRKDRLIKDVTLLGPIE
ncbi:MAG: cytochrome c oxidase accessory protein CcoG [Bacteriovoracaceae bacterium]|jgi:cytochrome c oxidase accessory protein FixG|nr:cytochrome c oxidase accessory protein CcoG [Bacteriovoracaceae bacterium]